MSDLNIDLQLVAQGAGTVNVITANFTTAIPANSAAKIWIRSTGVNTITGVTLQLNGWSAKTIKARGNTTLRASDTGLAGYVMSLQFNVSGDYWELLNPATGTILESTTIAAADATAKANAALASAVAYTDSYAQPLNQDLTDISALTPSNDDILQRKAGAWVNRTIAQVWADLKASADALYVSLTGSYANPSWITSLAWSKITGKGTYSPFYISTVVTHTGTINETIVYSASPNLVGILEANDMFEFECTVMATNNGNTKNIRFYISDAQGSLSNQVLVGRTSVGTGWATSQRIAKYIKMKGALNSNQYIDNTVHLNQNNVYTAVLPSINNAGTIDFSTGAKYLIITLELASAGDTIQIFEGHSQIFRP